MRLFLTLGLCLFSVITLFGQFPGPRRNAVNFAGSIGLGLGGENIVSFPKLSGFAMINVGKRRRSNHGNFGRNGLYAGAEGSIVILFAGAASISATTGFKIGPFTTDCALTRLWLANPDGDIVGRQTTLNPKLGVMIGPVWVKAGPSFLLTDRAIFYEFFGSFMHVGQIPFNVEVNFNLTWQRI